MKNFAKLFVIIALMTVIGLTVACDIATEGGDPKEYDELREVATDGRLIINGLSAYDGQLIWAHTSLETFHTYLVACEQISLAYLNGEPVNLSESTDSTVIDGKATLKVFKENKDTRFMENYDGNDQNVEFHVGVGPEGATHAAYGTVTVSFANGVGTGDFVLVIE
ncbi:hypothetical protein R84B8_03253 [Treponema sp. R8-4-B8]